MQIITIDERYRYSEMSTSDGSQTKYYKDGYWYKLDYFGGEGEAEHLASLLLSHSNLSPDEYVTYDRAVINGAPGCYCESCIGDGEELISFYRLWENVRGGDMASFLQRMDYDDAIDKTIEFIGEQTGLDIHRYLANNLAFSMIIRNEDLHFNNLWVIFDGKSFHNAPILDNGKSMFVGNKKYDPSQSNAWNLNNTYSKVYGGSFELSYRHLERYCDLKINLKEALADLEKEEDSPRKRFLQFQLPRYPKIIT